MPDLHVVPLTQPATTTTTAAAAHLRFLHRYRWCGVVLSGIDRFRLKRATKAWSKKTLDKLQVAKNMSRDTE